MKSFAQVLFLGALMVSFSSAAAKKNSFQKDDPGLKSIKAAACSKRAELSLNDCTDSSCQKTPSAAKKTNGIDNQKAGG